MKIVFGCDESGAKGYADQDEACDGEVGVFAGLMVPDSHFATVEADLNPVVAKYQPATGKLHIADLLPAEQDALRKDVYAVVRKHSLPCFWYALHVAGLHRRHLEIQAVLEDARKEVAKRSSNRFKAGSPRENPVSMHVALFEGLYAHLVAFLEERGCTDVDVEIRTDRVDNPIVDKFEEVAVKLLADPIYNHTVTVKRFDTVTKKPVQGQIQIEAKLPESMNMALRVKSLTINAVDDEDGIVLVADVLSNHLNYLFMHRDAAEKYGPLNWPTAVAAHPLADHLDSFNNWGEGDIVGDRVYKHPKAP